MSASNNWTDTDAYRLLTISVNSKIFDSNDCTYSNALIVFCSPVTLPDAISSSLCGKYFSCSVYAEEICLLKPWLLNSFWICTFNVSASFFSTISTILFDVTESSLNSFLITSDQADFTDVAGQPASDIARTWNSIASP